MKRILLVILLIVALKQIQAQERQLFTSIPLEYFTTDLFDNVYAWSGSQLIQYDKEGKQLRQYSNPALGSITSVDVTYASKIMLFYQDAGVILLLDNQLSPIGDRINLMDNGWYTISLAAMIGTSELALYDPQNHTLILTDLQLNSPRITHCQLEENFEPFFMQSSREETIFMTDSTNGIYLFDILGTFQQRIALSHIHSASISGSEIVYLQNGKLQFYNRSLHGFREMDISDFNCTHFRIGSKNLYIQDENGLVYRIPIPARE